MIWVYRPQGTVKCSRCSGNHLSRACRCYNCQQIGHIASACKSGALSRQGKGRIQDLAVDAPAAEENESQSSEDELSIFGLYATNSDRVGRGYHVEVAVNGEYQYGNADGSRWYLVQVGGSTRRVHADHLIGALGYKKRSADLVDSSESQSALETESGVEGIEGPEGVSQFGEGSRSGPVPLNQNSEASPTSGNENTVAIGSSPAAGETEAGGTP